MTITISTSGSFQEFPRVRFYTIRLVNFVAPLLVTGNGVRYHYSAIGGRDTWSYDGIEFTTIIETGLFQTSDNLTIQIQNEAFDDKYMSGLKGAVKHSNLAKRNFDAAWNTPGSQTVGGGNISISASTGDLLSYLSGTNYNQYKSVLYNYRNVFNYAIKEVNDMRPIPPVPFGLLQMWSGTRNDNCLCGTTDCINSQSGYKSLRIEGYCVKENTPDAIKLNDFWNADIADNYATTTSATPSGYSPASFGNGYVLKSFAPGTVPLKLYWNDARKDMLTVASQEGINYAIQYNYTLLNNNLGYVYTNPPPSEDAPTYSSWAYSMELLLNALN